MPSAILHHRGRDVTFHDCDPTDCIEGYLLQGHWYELHVLEYLRSLNVVGGYVDVGAYIGTFSLFASAFCPASRVVAIEPNPASYAKLAANAMALMQQPHNGGIDAFHCAVSDRTGTCRMSGAEGNRGGSTMLDGGDIEVTTLDALLPFSGAPHPVVLKLDAENHELAVLRGASETLKTVQHIIIETWPKKTCDVYKVPYHGDEIAALLTDAGFGCPHDFGGDTFLWSRINAR